MRELTWRRRWRAIWPLTLLCAVLASRWMVEQVVPGAASSALSNSVGCVLAAIVLFTLHRVLQRSVPATEVGTLPWWRRLAGGPLLVAGSVAAIVSDRRLHGTDQALALGCSPIVLAIARVVAGENEDLTATIAPALAGVAGLLFLFPQPALDKWRYDLALCLLPTIVGVSAFVATTQTKEMRPDKATAPARGIAEQLLCGALFFTLLAAVLKWRGLSVQISVLASLLDGLTAWLILLALARAGARQFTAVYLAVPLLTLLEGFALERPNLDARSILGIGLLAWGTVSLLRPAQREARSSLLGEA